MRNSERDSLVAFVLRELAAIEPRLNEAHNNCREWHASGYPTTSLPQVGSSGGLPNDPTGNAALHVDSFAAQSAAADRLLESAHAAIAGLVAFVNTNTHRATGIYCGNLHCDRIMSGIDNDRPRGPQRECPRCYMHRRRHSAPWPHQALLPAVQQQDAAPVTLPGH